MRRQLKGERREGEGRVRGMWTGGNTQRDGRRQSEMIVDEER